MTIKELKGFLAVHNEMKVYVILLDECADVYYQNYKGFLADDSIDHRVIHEMGCGVHVGNSAIDIWVK